MLRGNSSSTVDLVGVPSSGLTSSTSLSKCRKTSLIGFQPPMPSSHDDVEWSDESLRSTPRRRDKTTSVKKAGSSSKLRDQDLDKGSRADGFIKTDQPAYRNPFDDTPQSAQKFRFKRISLNASPRDSTDSLAYQPPLDTVPLLSYSPTSPSLYTDLPYGSNREEESTKGISSLQKPERYVNSKTTRIIPRHPTFPLARCEGWSHAQGSQVGDDENFLKTPIDAAQSASGVQPESGSNRAYSRLQNITLTSQPTASEPETALEERRELSSEGQDDAKKNEDISLSAGHQHQGEQLETLTSLVPTMPTSVPMLSNRQPWSSRILQCLKPSNRVEPHSPESSVILVGRETGGAEKVKRQKKSMIWRNPVGRQNRSSIGDQQNNPHGSENDRPNVNESESINNYVENKNEEIKHRKRWICSCIMFGLFCGFYVGQPCEII
ncbi:hypothetical protein FRC02_002218 [Tulasnella sp. 418]|nr:hypothetical protein FRC02_002218 [Tulasnella sp. 418]